MEAREIRGAGRYRYIDGYVIIKKDIFYYYVSL